MLFPVLLLLCMACAILTSGTNVVQAVPFYMYRNGSMVRYDSGTPHFQSPSGASTWLSYRSIDDGLEVHHPDASPDASGKVQGGRRSLPVGRRAGSATATYNIDCTKNPEVCLNICYYAYCKGHGAAAFSQKKRASGRITAPDCKGLNRCSVRFNPAHDAGYQCDEYPLGAMEEGGTSNVATRCVIADQNGSAGSPFSQVPAGSDVSVTLGGQIPSFQGSFCSPLLVQGAADCSRDKGQPQLQM